MSDTRYRKVPGSRLSRLAGFGQLAGGLAGGMLAEAARKLTRGERPHLSDLLLTPANALRLTDQLSRLRGAAMKLGQMISLDAGDMLPVELSAILARLRDGAHRMPPAQLNRVLADQWGADWRGRFASFDTTAIAAASIGQVHRAVLHDGRVVAVKVQYPGVADSIDADVDNVATLLRMSGLLPDSLDVRPLLAEAKQQLREEADYGREAEQMRRYGDLLAGDEAFIVPSPVAELSGSKVLVMDFLSGAPIDTLASAPQAVRNKAMAALIGLALRELFSFGFIQTDPNFANYRWQAETGRIVLLDFGAARAVPDATRAPYRRLMQAGLAGDRMALKAALVKVGFVSQTAVTRHGRARYDDRRAHDPSRPPRPDRLCGPGFVEELRVQARSIVADRSAWHIPPADTLFIQRKISGTALLAVRMKAQLPLRAMVAEAVGDA
jgi:predicted unusual protein kinase regulating ubiquinone biosynthesis (AarF/ABC1/UbiB family)